MFARMPRFCSIRARSSGALPPRASAWRKCARASSSLPDRKSNPPSVLSAAAAWELCNRSYTVAGEQGSDFLAAEALNTLGGLDLRSGKLEDARAHFLQALARGGKAPELLARIEQNLGILANIKGEIEAAVSHYERAVEWYLATNDEHGCANAYVNLGIAHTDLRQYDWADSYLSKSFEIAQHAGDLYLQGLCLVNLAQARFERERSDEARRNAEAALSIFDHPDERGGKSAA